MPRLSFETICIDIAKLIAQRSTCARLSVGCVITSSDFRKILSWGYNANASGLPNCCDRQEPGNCGCIHAEANAVINCDSPRYVEKKVFVTHLPCPMCAKYLINLGNVKEIFFTSDYRNDAALQILNQAGILVSKLENN